MIYSLLVLSSPTSGYSARSAVLFAKALIHRGHKLKRVFFMDEGCFAGMANRVTPQDEQDPIKEWSELAQAHQIDLVLCISSAIKRGLMDQTEASRYDAPGANIAAGFSISGLGQLVEACADADRVITFGG